MRKQCATWLGYLVESAPLIEATTPPASKINCHFSTALLMRHSSQGPTTVSKKKMQLKDLGPKAAWENAGDEVTYF